MAGDFEIEVRLQTRRYQVSVPRLKKIAKGILKRLGWNCRGGSRTAPVLSILLVNDRSIRELNRRWLARDRPTDVMAFGIDRAPRARCAAPPHFLGDIVISLETARRQAEQYGNSFFYELCFYLCHGVLHLMGYGDRTKKEAAKMDKIQQRLLEKIGVRNLKS